MADVIQFHCPACGTTLRVPPAAAGFEGPCPRCARLIVGPDPALGLGARLAGTPLVRSSPESTPAFHGHPARDNDPFNPFGSPPSYPSLVPTPTVIPPTVQETAPPPPSEPEPSPVQAPVLEPAPAPPPAPEPEPVLAPVAIPERAPEPAPVPVPAAPPARITEPVTPPAEVSAPSFSQEWVSTVVEPSPPLPRPLRTHPSRLPPEIPHLSKPRSHTPFRNQQHPLRPRRTCS